MKDELIEIVREHGPMKFRYIEAYLVLKGFDESTFSVQRALRELVDECRLIKNDNFEFVTPEDFSRAVENEKQELIRECWLRMTQLIPDEKLNLENSERLNQIRWRLHEMGVPLGILTPRTPPATRLGADPRLKMDFSSIQAMQNRPVD